MVPVLLAAVFRANLATNSVVGSRPEDDGGPGRVQGDGGVEDLGAGQLLARLPQLPEVQERPPRPAAHPYDGGRGN